MSNSKLHRFGITPLAIALFAAAVSSAAQAPGQNPPADQSQPQPPPDSVADAARKSKADKPKTGQKKVFTDEDLPSLKSGGLSVVGEKDLGGSPAGAPKPGAKPSGADATKNAKDEAYWRARAKKIRDQMNDVDQQISALRDEMKRGGNAGFDMQTGRNQNVVFFEDRNAKLKSLEKRKDELQKEMEALEEEARRADVPVGWLR